MSELSIAIDRRLLLVELAPFSPADQFNEAVRLLDALDTLLPKRYTIVQAAAGAPGVGKPTSLAYLFRSATTNSPIEVLLAGSGPGLVFAYKLLTKVQHWAADRRTRIAAAREAEARAELFESLCDHVIQEMALDGVDSKTLAYLVLIGENPEEGHLLPKGDKRVLEMHRERLAAAKGKYLDALRAMHLPRVEVVDE